jgi:hypothetical protein
MEVAMRRPRYLLLTLLALALVSGCARPLTPEELRVWVGRPVASLEKDWGAATREVREGDLRILIYEEVTKNTARDFERTGPTARAAGPYGVAQAAANEAYRLPTVYVRSYLFWVNPGGRIVNSAVHQP